MRLHTCLDQGAIFAAMQRAMNAGQVAPDVTFIVLCEYPSRTHTRSFEIQLGVSKGQAYQRLPEHYVNQYGKRQKTRRSSQNNGSWAATYHEWGWFIAQCFEADPESRWGTNPERSRNPNAWGYFNQDDFDTKTSYKFCLDEREEPDLAERTGLTPTMTEPVQLTTQEILRSTAPAEQYPNRQADDEIERAAQEARHERQQMAGRKYYENTTHP